MPSCVRGFAANPQSQLTRHSPRCPAAGVPEHWPGAQRAPRRTPEPLPQESQRLISWRGPEMWPPITDEQHPDRSPGPQWAPALKREQTLASRHEGRRCTSPSSLDVGVTVTTPAQLSGHPSDTHERPETPARLSHGSPRPGRKVLLTVASPVPGRPELWVQAHHNRGPLGPRACWAPSSGPLPATQTL